MSAAPKVIIVAGLARCGTSLTMQMLQAGGVPCLGEYPSFEHPCAASPAIDYLWLAAQRGRAVKLLDPHRGACSLRTIYATVIWLDRDPVQQAKSQIKLCNAIFPEMGAWRTPVKVISSSLIEERPQALAAAGFGVHSWLTLPFENLIEKPMESAQQIQRHLAADGIDFDWQMAWRVVRARPTTCLDGLLEVELMKGLRARA